jgi:peptide/nickel transport system permease protein
VVREQKYVEAARASGAGNGRILRKHVIPNSVFPVFIQMSLDVGTVPLVLAAIAYLGFIIFPAQLIPEWGSVAAASTDVIPSLFQYCSTVSGACQIPWWQILFPGIALFLFAISVNLLADGLRDALDPRLRR